MDCPAGKLISPAGLSQGASVIGQVGTTGVFAKDFISWRACLGDMGVAAKGPADRPDAARPRFGCSEFHSPAGHRGPDVYRSVPGPGTDPVRCYQRLHQARRREPRPSGREPSNGDFAGSVHRGHQPASALFSKSVAENRRQPADTRGANGRPGHRL
jgi:hypothetical protein